MISDLTKPFTYEFFSRRLRSSFIASLYLSAFSPEKVIVLIIGFSSTVIVNLLLSNSIDIFEKKLVS